MECYCYLRNLQDLVADGKSACERRFGESFKGTIIPFGASVEYHQSEHVIKSEFIILERKLHQESFWDMYWSRSDYGKEIADLQELYNMDASEIYLRQGDEFKFPFADGTATLSGRGYEFREPIQRREQTVRSEDVSGELQSESEEPQSTEPSDDAEARKNFWSIDSTWLHSSPKETFPIPLKYIDVTRSTDTDLDVKQEKRLDDYWNVYLNRSLSASWKSFTKFTLLKKKNHPNFFCGLGGDWQKFERLPDLIMCGLKYGPRLERPLRIEKNKNRQLKNPNSVMPGNWEEFTSLSQMRKNIRRQRKMQEKNGNTHGTGFSL